MVMPEWQWNPFAWIMGGEGSNQNAPVDLFNTGGGGGGGGGGSWGSDSVTPESTAAEAYRTLYGRDPDPNDPVYQQMIAAAGGQVPTGGTGTADTTSTNSLLDFYRQLGLSEDQAQAAALQQAGLAMTPYQAAQLEDQRLQRQQSAANTGASVGLGYAQLAASQARAEWEKAIAEGNLELAQQKQADYNHWQSVSAEFSALSQANSEANTGISAYNSLLGERNARTGAGFSAADVYGQLASLTGNLAVQQQQLGLDILTNPRNAIAGFLMGIGADPNSAGAFGDFNVQRILGINPAAINQFIADAAAAAQQAQQAANNPIDINLQDLITGLQDRANAIVGGLPTGPDTVNVSTPSAAGPTTKTSGPVTPKETTTQTRVPTATVTTTPSTLDQFIEPDRGPFVNTNLPTYPTIDRILAGGL